MLEAGGEQLTSTGNPATECVVLRNAELRVVPSVVPSMSAVKRVSSHGKARGRHSTDDSARFVSVMVSVRVPERRHYTP